MVDKKDKQKKVKARSSNTKSKKIKADNEREKRRKLALVIFLSGLLIGLILIIWIFLNLSSESVEDDLGISCIDFVKSISIESACNLNENEVQVTLKRIDGDFFVERIEFEFFPSDSLWKVDGSKCLDVRLEDKKYGSYCDILREEQTASYIFHHSLGKQKEVILFVTKNTLSCRSDSKEIERSCD